jgi:hypothetical protein
MRVRPSDRIPTARADDAATRRRDAARASARFLFALALCALFASGGALAQSQQNGGGDARLKAEQEMDRIAKENGIARGPVVNTTRFLGVALTGKELYEQGKLKLDGPLEMTATAELNEDGTFKPGTLKLEATSSDGDTLFLAREILTALSQSRLFGVIRGAKDVRLSLRLDRENVSVQVANELPSEEEAARYAKGYGFMLAVARDKKKGTDEGEIYNALKFANDGKLFQIFFEMRRDLAGKMLADALAKAEARFSN